ncbi:MAG TPA: hypothetical protein DDZ66_04740 [Firmicutes bacterium]|jgi:hypothetical protein|nr:hypothetical protein [Bacillota bacterium]
MHFTVAEWAYEVWGEGDYDPNPTGEFARGERGYAYLEIADFGIGERDQLFFLQLDVDVALETKNGLRLFYEKDVLELEEYYLEPPESTWFYIYVDIPWWAPRGSYVTVITVRDGVAELSLEEKREITVR